MTAVGVGKEHNGVLERRILWPSSSDLSVTERPIALQPVAADPLLVTTGAAAVGLGDRLRELREAQRPPLSQTQLARLAGIDRGYLSKIEAGRRPLPSPDVVHALAFALATTSIDLLQAAGYVLVTEAVDLPEVIADAQYRFALRRAATIADPVLRRFVLAAIREAVAASARPAGR